MKENLYAYRKSYEKGVLLEDQLEDSPIKQFQKWFDEIRESKGVEEPNAMTVSTIDPDGFPKSRVVLLKKYDDSGFYFYTNYHSDKGRSIAEHPELCLSFFWPNLERQVIIQGIAEKTSREDSTSYFHSRPRGSQLGAIASRQSEVIRSREVLEKELENLEKKYRNTEIPKPENWGGYLVKPVSVEFWQGRANRLHDRILYKKEGKTWIRKRLAP